MSTRTTSLGISRLHRDRKAHQHTCAATLDRIDATCPTQLSCALPHREEPDAWLVVGRKAAPIVGYLQLESRAASEADSAGMGLGVAYDISERFLGDSVGGNLERCREIRQALWRIYKYMKLVAVAFFSGCTILGHTLPDRFDES